MKALTKNIPLWAYFIFVILAATSLGFYTGKTAELSIVRKTFRTVEQIRLPNDNYPLVSKLVGVEFPDALDFGIYTDLYSQIKEYTDKEIDTQPISKFSFYFRDLNSGLWFGINEDTEYIPASLFKLPIAMAYYKDVSDDPYLLSKVLTYTKEDDEKLDTQIGLEKSELVIGRSYTISELIDKMLIDSDNGAKNLLTEKINTKTLNTLFNLIQLSNPEQNNYYLSPKEFAFMMRALYNGSYLGQQKSQTLLSKLSETSFSDGIRKSIPQDIPLVHKFGVVTLIDKDTKQKQIGFNDCGIVYYPEKPFLVCFMTKGNDREELNKVVQKVTGYVLDYVKNN